MSTTTDYIRHLAHTEEAKATVILSEDQLDMISANLHHCADMLQAEHNAAAAGDIMAPPQHEVDECRSMANAIAGIAFSVRVERKHRDTRIELGLS